MVGLDQGGRFILAIGGDTFWKIEAIGGSIPFLENPKLLFGKASMGISPQTKLEASVNFNRHCLKAGFFLPGKFRHETSEFYRGNLRKMIF